MPNCNMPFRQKSQEKCLTSTLSTTGYGRAKKTWFLPRVGQTDKFQAFYHRRKAKQTHHRQEKIIKQQKLGFLHSTSWTMCHLRTKAGATWTEAHQFMLKLQQQQRKLCPWRRYIDWTLQLEVYPLLPQNTPNTSLQTWKPFFWDVFCDMTLFSDHRSERSVVGHLFWRRKRHDATSYWPDVENVLHGGYGFLRAAGVQVRHSGPLSADHLPARVPHRFLRTHFQVSVFIIAASLRNVIPRVQVVNK